MAKTFLQSVIPSYSELGNRNVTEYIKTHAKRKLYFSFHPALKPKHIQTKTTSESKLTI